MIRTFLLTGLLIAGCMTGLSSYPPVLHAVDDLDSLPYGQLIVDDGKNNAVSCEIHFIDVGYGDSIFMVLPEQITVLVDGGYEEQGEKVFRYIRPYIKNRALDWMICTHPHPDHIGGLLKVAEMLDVHRLIINMKPSHHDRLQKLKDTVLKRNKKTDIRIVERGDVLHPLKNLSMHVLHPKNVNKDLNYSSLVFMMEYKDFRILLGGDIEQKAEKELTETYGSKLRAQVLKLPHHGNLGYPGFIDEVKPLIGIITVAENEWGAPHGTTLGLLEKNRVTVLRTDETGDMFLQLEDDGYITIKTAKKQELRIKAVP